MRIAAPRHLAAGCVVLALGAALALPGAKTFAQDARAVALAREMIGNWELATAERGRTCAITLRSEHVPGGMRADLDPGCAAELPFTKAIAGWSIRGLDIVRLQTKDGEPVIDLTEVESGMFEGMRTGEGIYLLQNLEAARELARSMDQMIGDWELVRGSGRALCNLTLTNTEIDRDFFQVFLSPGCTQPVAAFNPVKWRFERGEIILLSASGEAWRFQADDRAQWRRVPEAADPLMLVRK
ncbi:MAG TPA: AprI/Inh family metalloprotease inhibitor [Xanthobacteraceae bacterium]|nr:AprI/Inh family metalloprotease inhibitor [Xanthobacteraceae bacterium]